MKKLNNPQLWLIIFTLIAGIAYMMFRPSDIMFPGLTPNTQNPVNTDPTDSVTDSNNPERLENSNPIDISETPAPFKLAMQNNPTVQSASLAIDSWKTSNNVPVYFVQAKELPMVDISLTVKAGAAYSADKPGVASLTSAMLSEGTKKYDTEELAEQLENIGAEFSSSAGKDSANLVLRSLTDEQKLNTALKVLTDIIANSNFPTQSFNRIKKQSIENLKLEQQYPETIVNEIFYKSIYKDHPYAISSDGTIDSVSKITNKDIINFYKQFYVSQNTLISIVGNLESEQAKKIAELISNSIPSGKPAKNLPQAQKLDDKSIQHINFPSTQTHILIGSVGIKRSDPDYFALTVGNHILGKLPLTSLLFKNIRVQRGLAYSVYSSFMPMQNEGPFYINMQTRNEKSEEALNVTLDTLNKFITDGPSQEQLDLAKQNLTGSYPLSISSNRKKLGMVSSIAFYDLPLDYLDTYVDNINKITIDDIKQAFAKHVDLNKLSIVTVGKSKNQQESPAQT